MKKSPPETVGGVPFPLMAVRADLFQEEASDESLLVTFHRNPALSKPGGCTRGGAAMHGTRHHAAGLPVGS